ncbi:MAG: glutaminyl-peptide cyclotransferase [Chitinophagaceae bacterium]|nr:MAG: glutaminyl-peptide cyclotransferase [Chitinophagaceae bacterium]
MKSLFYSSLLSLFLFACNSTENNHQTNIDVPPTASTPIISHNVIKEYPHDPSFFTQGLLIYKGNLYESTGGSAQFPQGNLNHSYLMKVDINTGKPVKKIDIDPNFFGEGIAILNDTIYQLTWTEKKVFVYDLNFKKIKEFNIDTDGWGITTDGKELIVSTGDSNLYFYDPSTFRLLRKQAVTVNGELANNINELEYINGFVYANKWQSAEIYKINPQSGIVEGIINLSDLRNQLGASIADDTDKVLNGIAYDADSKKLYVTGKNWPKLFEIQLGSGL